MSPTARDPAAGGAEPRRGGRREPDFLVVGHLVKPHGTKGEVFVWPLTEFPDIIFAVGRELYLGDTEGALGDAPLRLEVAASRHFKRGLLICWEGYVDRTSVTPFAGRYLLAPIDAVPPLEEGEVHYHQLLELEVVTVEGEVVGKVREVYETVPSHLLEVEGDGRVHLIPFVDEIVREIDLEAGRLIIDPPPGLLEL